MQKLYWARGTISIAVAIALEEAGLNYEAVQIDFASGAQTKPDYLAINPKGRVPALVTEDGTVLTETGALLEYIAALAPAKAMVPSAPQDAAHMRAVMYYLASTMHVAHAHKMRGSRWADKQSSWDDMTAKVPETVAACAAFFQSDCLRGPLVMGDSFSIADAYAFVVCNWLEGDGVPPANYPAIATFLATMETRDSVKAVRARDML